MQHAGGSGEPGDAGAPDRPGRPVPVHQRGRDDAGAAAQDADPGATGAATGRAPGKVAPQHARGLAVRTSRSARPASSDGNPASKRAGMGCGRNMARRKAGRSAASLPRVGIATSARRAGNQGRRADDAGRHDTGRHLRMPLRPGMGAGSRQLSYRHPGLLAPSTPGRRRGCAQPARVRDVRARAHLSLLNAVGGKTSRSWQPFIRAGWDAGSVRARPGSPGQTAPVLVHGPAMLRAAPEIREHGLASHPRLAGTIPRPRLHARRARPRTRLRPSRLRAQGRWPSDESSPGHCRVRPSGDSSPVAIRIAIDGECPIPLRNGRGSRPRSC